MSSSSADGNGNGGARRCGDSEGPSLTRRCTNNEIWQGPFLEDLVLQVAIDASRSSGRLAAAVALANVFQGKKMISNLQAAKSETVKAWGDMVQKLALANDQKEMEPNACLY
ncbi:hypothetical protein PVK06_038783 [Gossypium arboreum]|uniref:Uncharacterized protein n=1 Tax=Gossypium arboreum TaxID=29729 RepID=A0ABR0N303_GOSAR|nr:hypothetical protein PVK06_038783 [Gossypium arboreum]